ncbi:THAP domain-containing protein 2 [Chionoecetes opilio]|uniref:THAP domain-containing protein 2 n=1 Tax=Chionoecetes opilio TaxID=41210 RepID=A0A8J5CWN1_CHIOP|nr:THAP domain-containing protein 2 [Chionoecetes opilio]
MVPFLHPGRQIGLRPRGREARRSVEEESRDAKVMLRAGCKSNYSSVDASGFRFPKDEQRRVQWIRAIHREDFMPTENTVVCAKHSEQRFIITEDSITRPDGTIITAKRGWPTLTKDAFPTIFVNQPKYMTKEVPPARTTLQERRDRIIEHDEMVLRN